MIRRILQNMIRQRNGLHLLHHLLKEEFSLLEQHNPQGVTAVEFSIHELMRQLVVEREELRGLLQGKRLVPFIEDMEAKEEAAGIDTDPEKKTKGQMLRGLFEEIDKMEQTCARQAERNTEMAMSLYDQTTSLLTFLHKEIVPKKEDVYTAKGRYPQQSRPDASLLKGRL